MKRVTLTRPTLPRRGDDYVRGAALREIPSQKTNGRLPPSPPPLPLKGRGWGVGDDQQGATVSKEKKGNVSLADLLEQADKLPATEKKTLLAHLALKDQDRGTEVSRDQDMWAQAVYEALARAIGHEGGAGQGPALIKRTLSVSSVWSPIAKFLMASHLADLNVTERQSVLILIARLVTEHAQYVARKSGAPLSAKLVGSCSAHVASIFDNAFPGYLASGLAPIVARQFAGLAH